MLVGDMSISVSLQVNVIVLPCCFGCCELASTFNVLTWRVMPDLQALLWTRRTTFPVFASQEVSQPVSLRIGVHHRRCCSATVVVLLLERVLLLGGELRL